MGGAEVFPGKWNYELITKQLRDAGERIGVLRRAAAGLCTLPGTKISRQFANQTHSSKCSVLNILNINVLTVHNLEWHGHILVLSCDTINRHRIYLDELQRQLLRIMICIPC